MSLPELPSADAQERSPHVRSPLEVPASIQNITPECRRNRASLGALEEALERIRRAYIEYHDVPDNAAVTWRVSLVRVEPS